VSGVRETKERREIIKLLSNHLCELDGGCYKILKITEISQQVVAGMLYRVSGIFENEDEEKFKMTVTIWSMPWMNFVELTIVDKAAI
jgi:hypothetical protein